MVPKTPTLVIPEVPLYFRPNYRMAKTVKRLNAILNYVRKVKSSISMVFGLVS